MLDIIAGPLEALRQRSLKSDIIRSELLKKVGIFDELVNMGLPVLQTMMIIMTICDEILSIIESLNTLGCPFLKNQYVCYDANVCDHQ
ncbi:phage holin family protein [Sporolactobacillus shoreicorticis]|uniref:phage holin family protein n=1 Tax=Sporolactobacillus shoreicorticis TaxID=1923877 RepID=UPI0035A15D95